MLSTKEVVNLQKIRRREQRSGAITRWDYGIQSLDKKTGGFSKDENVVLIADSGIGKSAFAMSLAYNVAEQFEDTNLDVRYVTREMSALALQDRLVCSTAHPPIPLDHLRDDWKGLKDELRIREEEAYDEQLEVVQELPIRYITNGYDMDDIFNNLAKTVDGRKCGFFIIDYLGLMPGCSDPVNGIRTMGKVSEELTEFTKEYSPGLTICQIPKSVLNRDNKRPQKNDALGAGSILHNATLLLALYRPDVYLELSEERQDDPRPGELIIRKNRNGVDRGTIKMIFLPTIAKWIEDERGKKK